MARRKPCEFCAGSSTLDEVAGNGQLVVEIYPEVGLIGVMAYAQDDAGDTVEMAMEINMHYCPECGRRLV